MLLSPFRGLLISRFLPMACAPSTSLRAGYGLHSAAASRLKSRAPALKAPAVIRASTRRGSAALPRYSSCSVRREKTKSFTTEDTEGTENAFFCEGRNSDQIALISPVVPLLAKAARPFDSAQGRPWGIPVCFGEPGHLRQRLPVDLDLFCYCVQGCGAPEIRHVGVVDGLGVEAFVGLDVFVELVDDQENWLELAGVGHEIV